MKGNQKYSFASILMAIVIIAGACSSNSDRNSAENSTEFTGIIATTEDLTSTSVESHNSNSSKEDSSRLLDPMGSTTEILQSSEHYSEFDKLADAVDLVFVGTITGTSVNPVRRDPAEDDLTRSVTEFDGVIFEVEEVLRGKIPGGEGQVTIVQPVKIVYPEVANGQVNFSAREVLLRLPPVDQIATGIIIASEKRPNPPRYIIFADIQQFNDEVAFVFYGETGAVEVKADGSIVPNGVSPFSHVKKERNPYGKDVTLDVVRDWLNGSPPEFVRPPIVIGLEDSDE